MSDVTQSPLAPRAGGVPAPSAHHRPTTFTYRTTEKEAGVSGTRDSRIHSNRDGALRFGVGTVTPRGAPRVGFIVGWGAYNGFGTPGVGRGRRATTLEAHTAEKSPESRILIKKRLGAAGPP